KELAGREGADSVKARIAQVMDDAPALERLAREASDPFDKAVAVEGLGALGTAGEQTVLAAVSDSDPYVRQCAIEALESLNLTMAAEAARKGLDDPAAGVRLQAAKTLVVLARG